MLHFYVIYIFSFMYTMILFVIIKPNLNYSLKKYKQDMQMKIY